MSVYFKIILPAGDDVVVNLAESEFMLHDEVHDGYCNRSRNTGDTVDDYTPVNLFNSLKKTRGFTHCCSDIFIRGI